MIKETHIGMNRTGLKMAPRLADEMLENSEIVPTPGDEQAIEELRGQYIRSADPVGSVPPPATLRGAVKAGADLLTGKHPGVLLDKLSERLAFERGGVRLYDALINKCEMIAPDADVPPLETLRQFRDEEATHMELVGQVLRSLGADPTSMTPGADTVAVQASGLMQVLTDPRTTVAQCLNALLTAELGDNDGWRMLIALADALDMNGMAEAFREALENEDEHLATIRVWLSELVINEAMVM